MKLLLLFELIGLLSIGILVYPQIQLIAASDSLPERETLESQAQKENTDLLLASTEFEHTTISFYYANNQMFDQGIYYSSGLDKIYSFNQMMIHSDDYTLYFYADFGNHEEFMANGKRIEPVEILEIRTDEITMDIAIYHLQADQKILRKYKEKENYTSFCKTDENCIDTVYTDIDEFYDMVKLWTPVHEKDINSYGKQFESIVVIEDNWKEHILTQGTSSTHTLEISFLQTIGSTYLIKINGREVSYYSITESQLDQLNDFLNQ